MKLCLILVCLKYLSHSCVCLAVSVRTCRYNEPMAHEQTMKQYTLIKNKIPENHFHKINQAKYFHRIQLYLCPSCPKVNSTYPLGEQMMEKMVK